MAHALSCDNLQILGVDLWNGEPLVGPAGRQASRSLPQSASSCMCIHGHVHNPSHGRPLPAGLANWGGLAETYGGQPELYDGSRLEACGCVETIQHQARRILLLLQRCLQAPGSCLMLVCLLLSSHDASQKRLANTALAWPCRKTLMQFLTSSIRQAPVSTLWKLCVGVNMRAAHKGCMWDWSNGRHLPVKAVSFRAKLTLRALERQATP